MLLTCCVSPPPAVVTGYQQPGGAAPAHACQFYISLLDANGKEQRLDENGEGHVSVPPRDGSAGVQGVGLPALERFWVRSQNVRNDLSVDILAQDASPHTDLLLNEMPVLNGSRLG